MLVLTRKLQEQIRIGDDVVVTILQVRGQSVRVGIEAPRNVRVLRAELPVNQSSPSEPPKETVIAVEPIVSPMMTKAPSTVRGRPLSGRLQARRALNASLTPARQTHERLGPAMLALAGGIS
jgi:carbon storage regulator CsrA